MKKQDNAPTISSLLRQKAEQVVEKKTVNASSHFPKTDVLKLLHELEVHQIELQMQNNELTAAKEQAEIAAVKYSRLYDLAPTGYLTLSETGNILDINMSASQTLGLAYPDLINNTFRFFVSDDSKSIFNKFLNSIFSSKKEENCEAILAVQHKLPIYVHLTGICSGSGDQCLVIMVDISERRKAEDTLKKSNERNRSIILQTAMDGFWLIDTQGQLLEVNETYCRMSGYSEEDLLKMSISDLEANESVEVTGTHIKNTILLGEYRFETRHRRKDGSIFDVEISVQHQLNEGGRMVAFLHDITEYKLRDAALRESEQKFRTYINNAPLGIFVTNERGEYLDVNPAACQITGFSMVELLTMKIVDLIPENSLEYAGNHFKKVLTEGFATGELTFLRKDRLIRSWSVDAVKLSDQRFLAFVIDITDRKKADAELKQLNEELEDRVKERTAELSMINASLQQTEEKYRTVADYTYDWEYWIAPDGTIQFMSPSVERITGYTIDEFKADPQMRNRIILKDDQILWEKHIKAPIKLLDNEKNDNFEFRIVTKNGEIRWIDHTCRKIYSNGKYLGLRVSNRDITEKVKAENELLNITVKVEDLERNRISRELHDGLGPLLSTIKLYFQWLAETNDPQKMKIITEKGNQSIDRAMRTTREVSHGLSSHVLTQYGYVGAVFGFTQSINDTRKLNISFNPNSNERFNNLLEITLYRITTELINNTLNYAMATHVEIDFDYYKDKNMISFSYTDNGIGFDAADIEKSGKGIGLMNIRQRIKLLQGGMNIETGIGKGFKVHIELPVINPVDFT